jgi:hypothetical protein
MFVLSKPVLAVIRLAGEFFLQCSITAREILAAKSVNHLE